MKKAIRRITGDIYLKFGYSQEDFKEFCISNYEMKTFLIGVTELTEEEDKPIEERQHFHYYIEFACAKDWKSLQSDLVFFKSHFEVCRASLLENYNYCCKEGCYYKNIEIEKLFDDKALQKQIEQALIDDIFKNNLSLKLLCMKYPKYAIYHINNIKLLYQIKEEE